MSDEGSLESWPPGSRIHCAVDHRVVLPSLFFLYCREILKKEKPEKKSYPPNSLNSGVVFYYYNYYNSLSIIIQYY